MFQSGKWSFLLLGALTVALAVLGWRMARSPEEACFACARPAHHHSRALIAVGGETHVVCCPACALTYHQQTGEPVKIVELTDFQTGKALAPEQAFLVRGSGINLCAHQQGLMDDHKEAIPLEFDRCSPSMIAFGSRSAAETFEQQSGGVLLPFAEVQNILAAQP